MKDHDAATYRLCNEPKLNMQAANADLDGFVGAVEEARAKFKIPDFILAYSFPLQTEQGEEALMTGDFCMGHLSGHEAMAAGLLGRLQARRQERIGSYLAKAMKQKGEW